MLRGFRSTTEHTVRAAVRNGSQKFDSLTARPLVKTFGTTQSMGKAALWNRLSDTCPSRQSGQALDLFSPLKESNFD